MSRVTGWWVGSRSLTLILKIKFRTNAARIRRLDAPAAIRLLSQFRKGQGVRPCTLSRNGERSGPQIPAAKKHTLVIISLDQRNRSERVSSLLAVPFGSYGASGPTSKRTEPGETGLREPWFLKANLISVIEKKDLVERLPRRFSNAQMRELLAMVNRAIDPDADYNEPPSVY